MRLLSIVILAVLMFVIPAFSQITVACASNVQFAMNDLKTTFEQKNRVIIKVVYGASGKLTAQIKNGAPFDVFVSADMEFPESLFVWKCATVRPAIYAYGKLVLWTANEFSPDAHLNILKTGSFKRIALPDPKRAPYGREAVKALENKGLYNQLNPKLVFGESVTQTAQYIETRAADIGFNAKSVVVAGPMKSVGRWVEVDSTLYNPIAQGAVILLHGKNNNPEISKKFFEFLYCKEAGTILMKYGYNLPKL